jgi:hypothetical protein
VWELSGDQQADTELHSDFQELIAKENIQLDQIHNSDEMVILEVSANKIANFHTEWSTPGHKLSKGRITVLCCVHAFGPHNLNFV